jgi:hypothetical protein
MNGDLPTKNVLHFPASVFDTSKPAADKSNVAFIKRKLVDVDEEGNSYLACFCKDLNGKQLAAAKKTARTFTCQKLVQAATAKQACGFRINQPTLTHLQEHEVIKHTGELTVPVCKKCCGSWLLYSNSEKIKDKELQHVIAYVCNCDPFSAKINIPIDDASVADDFDLAAYAKSRGQVTKGSGTASVKPQYYLPQ